MKIQDRIYGQVNIEELILLELMASEPLQRLKGIKQSLSNQTVSRYEHSLGVMILLKILKAPLEEQIVGLLHDVPHTAFSHVIDYVFSTADHSHEFHEKFHEQMIKNSEIPEILAKYNYDVNKILDEDNFSLLERKLPDLCADRIDYSLRDRIAMGEDTSQIATYLKNLIVKADEIVFTDKNVAKDFAQDYLEMDYKHWSSPREIALYQILANALKLALEHQIISQADLFSDDDFVYQKLQHSKDPEILKSLAKISSRLEIMSDKNNYDFYARNKLRFVDPKFLDPSGQLARVSQVFPKFKQILAKHQTWVEAGQYIKIVAY